MKNSKKLRRAASLTAIVCLLSIAGICAFKIITILMEYDKGQKAYEAIQEVAAQDKDKIDFDKLSEINPDVVAWIKLEGENIDYPIVQTTDNDKYLVTMFDGTVGGCGTLFVDCRSNNPFKGTNTVIYGHHMKDGSMFAALRFYSDKAYAEEHPNFTLYTPNTTCDVEVAAYMVIDAEDQLYDNDYINSKGPKAWVKRAQSKASYLTGVEMGEKDHYVMLSTCLKATGRDRIVVIGKLVPRK